MKITKLHPLVWVFHQALSNPADIISFYENNYEWEDWYTFGKAIDIDNIRQHTFEGFPSKDEFNEAYNEETFLQLKKREEADHLISITNTFYTVTKEFFTDNNITIKEQGFFPFSLAKYVAGPAARMNFHTDYKKEDSDKPGPNKHTTAIFYLNDDYVGGEICFVELDENQQIVWYNEYKPQAGDVVVFSSKDPIYHGVKTVESGYKYILRTYWEEIEPATEYWLQGIEQYGESVWRDMEEYKTRKLRSQIFHTHVNGEYIGIQYINTDKNKP